MAVDVKKYCYLLDPLFQVENIAGKPAVGGHIEVFHAGTDTPYITYQNFDGTHNPFKIPLNNDGRAVILAEPYYTYDVYCYDSFNNMICSRLNVMPQVGGDVSVSGFTEVWHDDTLSGEGTPQSPLTVIGGGGSGGKTYSGIDPIVVNNEEDKISANTVPFGVQEPLYFVEDETATIIGLSGNPSADAVNWVTAQGYLQRPDLIGYATKDFVEEEVSGKYDTSAFSTISGAFLTGLPEGSMNESAFGYSGGLITSYNGSAFKAGDEFPQSATDAIQVVTSNSGNWDTVTGKLDATASGDFYTTANPSGFITGVDLTPYQTTAGMTGYATKDDVSGLQSASTWNDAVNTVSSNSASWTGIEYTGVSPIVVDNASRSISADTWTVTFGSGLSAIDDTANSATTVVVTAQGGGGSSDVFIAQYGVTTFQEVASAVSSNKVVVAYSEPTIYNYNAPWTVSYKGSNEIDFVTFRAANGDSHYYAYSIKVTTAGWDNNSTVKYGVPYWKVGYVPVGAVLTKVDAANIDWKAISQVPSSTSADENKVLTVNSAGTPEWQSAQGGGELPQSATEAIEAVTSNSAYWDRAYSAVDSNSGAWSETYGAVNGMSAEWTSAFTSVNMGSGAWDSAWAAIYGPDASANLWNQASTAVTAGSGVWDDTYFNVNQNSGNWNDSRDVVTAGSSYWDATYLTVNQNSASWAGGTGGDMFASGLGYTTGGEISSYSGSAFASTDPTYELSAGDGISLTTGASALTIGCTLTLATGSI